MKKINNLFITVTLLLISITFYGCVDRDYAINNLTLGEVRIGDVIRTPRVRIPLPLEGILGGTEEIEKLLEDNGITWEDIDTIPIDIETSYSFDIPLTVPLVPDDMIDMLNTEDGKVELLLDLKSTLPLSGTLKLYFTDFYGNIIIESGNIEIEQSENGEEKHIVPAPIDITDNVDNLHILEELTVEFEHTIDEKIFLILDSYLITELRIQATGGIKLDLNKEDE